VPARIGHLRAAELILLEGPFDARRAAELGSQNVSTGRLWRKAAIHQIEYPS
jgi:enoyl-CoA hydratase/carnithine racemase